MMAGSKKKEEVDMVVGTEDDPMTRLIRVEAAVRFVASQLSMEQYEAFASCFPSIANKE